jgi:hypothetical protein
VGINAGLRQIVEIYLRTPPERSRKLHGPLAAGPPHPVTVQI